MKRRTVVSIIGISLFSGVSLFKWYDFHRVADLKILISYKTLIVELAETIIPRTDTPGAKDAQVEDFIIDFIISCTDNKNQNIFLSGLIEIQKYSIREYSNKYEACTDSQKIEILSYFEQKANSNIGVIGKIKNKLLGRPFFNQLKELTVIGYCTSQIGATTGLAYDYIPSSFYPCVELLPGQKSWATK